jgi:endoglucanase
MALGKNKSARDLYASASSSQLKTTIPENKETNPAFYYDYVLSLFGMGHFENRFRFLANGKLELPWLEQNCKLTN